MTPQDIKAKVQAAYAASLQNRAVRYGMRTSPLDHQFRDLKLYGRDAGADFADTTWAASSTRRSPWAGRKQPSMETAGLRLGAGGHRRHGRDPAPTDRPQGRSGRGRFVRLIWALDTPGWSRSGPGPVPPPHLQDLRPRLGLGRAFATVFAPVCALPVFGPGFAARFATGSGTGRFRGAGFAGAVAMSLRTDATTRRMPWATLRNASSALRQRVTSRPSSGSSLNPAAGGRLPVARADDHGDDPHVAPRATAHGALVLDLPAVVAREVIGLSRATKTWASRRARARSRCRACRRRSGRRRTRS